MILWHHTNHSSTMLLTRTILTINCVAMRAINHTVSNGLSYQLSVKNSIEKLSQRGSWNSYNLLIYNQDCEYLQYLCITVEFVNLWLFPNLAAAILDRTYLRSCKRSIQLNSEQNTSIDNIHGCNSHCRKKDSVCIRGISAVADICTNRS